MSTELRYSVSTTLCFKRVGARVGKKESGGFAQTVATQPRQLHYSSNLSKKKLI